MNEKRKRFYKEGLAKWEKALEFVLKSMNESCHVCYKNHCYQYTSAKHEISELARDCPLQDERELCQKLRELKEKQSDLYMKIDEAIIQIKGLHAKVGIEKNEETS